MWNGTILKHALMQGLQNFAQKKAFLGYQPSGMWLAQVGQIWAP